MQCKLPNLIASSLEVSSASTLALFLSMFEGTFALLVNVGRYRQCRRCTLTSVFFDTFEESKLVSTDTSTGTLFLNRRRRSQGSRCTLTSTFEVSKLASTDTLFLNRRRRSQGSGCFSVSHTVVM
jgi:hypothetical protein